MSFLHALILGIIEGLTEFLPISSTAHLIITSKLLNISQTEFVKFFEVFIQSGAIMAVVIMYFQYILKNKHLISKIVLSFLPTAVIGYLLHGIIKAIFFESLILIITMLFIIGVFFLLFEYLIKIKIINLNKSITRLSYIDAIIIGLGQSLAVIPGVSRAGIVMLLMMVKGYKRDQSAIYSFLLAVPTIFAASAYDLVKTNSLVILNGNIIFLVIGFISAFITAYIAVKWLINYLKSNSLVIFGWYRIIIALLLFMV